METLHVTYEYVEESPYQKLANAVLLRACKDYAVARRNYEEAPTSKNKYALKELDRYFNSDLYALTTSIDSEIIKNNWRDIAI